jgi:hypothetical protein
MKNRNGRTILLGVFATATLVWSAINHFSVPIEEMAWLLAYSALGVLFIMLLAAAAVAVLQAVKSLRRKDSAHPTSPAAAEDKARQD